MVTDATGANTYKWQKADASGNWADVSGARAKTLSFTSLTLSQAGQYRAVASGTGGQSTSKAASLQVDTAYVAARRNGDATGNTGVAPFTRPENGRQTLTLASGSGAFAAVCSKYVAADSSVLAGGTANMVFTNSDPSVAEVSAMSSPYLLGINPIKPGKTTLMLIADAQGSTPDGIGVIEITVT